MGGETWLIRGRIVAFDQDRFVRLHLRYVEPAVGRIVLDAVDLAGSIAIDQIGGDKISEGDGRRVADGQWRIAQRPPDRAPHIDDFEPMAEQFFRLFAHKIAHALRAGIDRVVIVNGGDRLARRSSRPVDATPDATAHRVIEYQYPGGAGDFGDETLGLGVIDAAQLVLVIKVANRAVVLDHSKTFAVERQTPCYSAGVVDHHAVRLGHSGRTRNAGGRFVGQIHRPFRHRREIVEDTLYIGEAIDDIMGKGHNEFLLVYGA